MTIIFLKVLFSIVGSYFISYFLTMTAFWIDLNINNPNKEEIILIKKNHLKTNKYIWLIVFLILIVNLV